MRPVFWPDSRGQSVIEELFENLQGLMPHPPFPPMWLGAQYATQRDAPVERIVVIPDSESYEGPDSVHALIGAPVGAVCANTATRVTMFETLVWGRTFSTTEALLMHFLEAIRKCIALPSLVLPRATWVRPDFETIGQVLRLTWGVKSQVWAPPEWEGVWLEGLATQCGCDGVMEVFPVRPVPPSKWFERPPRRESWPEPEPPPVGTGARWGAGYRWQDGSRWGRSP